MAIARPIRMLGAASIILCLFIVFQLNKGPSFSSLGGTSMRDPLLDRKSPLYYFSLLFSLLTIAATGEPDGPLWRATDNDYAPDSKNSARTNAALISLVRNEELDELIPTMRDLERTWNSKFNYPWIFFNDKPFTEEFKRRTQAETNAKCQFGTPCLAI